MINFDDYVNENRTEHNKNWPYTPDHPYKILIIGGSGSRKTNVLLNLIENQLDIDKIYLYAKDPYEEKYQYLIKIHKKVSLKRFNDPKAFVFKCILYFVLSIQMICTMSTKILMITMYIRIPRS